MADPVPPIDRTQFPIRERCVYLNHALVAPLPRDAFEAARAMDEAWMLDGTQAWERTDTRVEEVRATAARLLGSAPDQVAFVKNTTEGLSFVAAGLDWAPGDRVVVADREFPSTLFPFLALEDRGVEVVRVAPEGRAGELPLDAFAAAIAGGRTRLVVVSWVQFGTGWRTDVAGLAALAHEHGALLCVDVIQGAGVVPCELEAWGVDFAAADAHKWLLGPQGIGVLHVARQHLERLRVPEPGWNAVVSRDDADVLDLVYDPTARRFEGGTLNYTGIAAMGAALDLLQGAGVDAVFAHVDALCSIASDVVVAIGGELITTGDPAHRAGIVTFTVPGWDGRVVVDALAERDIVAKARSGGVRLSPHGWNTAEEVRHAVAAVAEITGRA